MMDIIAKKNTGSFYTCTSIADYIANWAIDKPNMSVLEPSFGDGIFIDSALNRFAQLGCIQPHIIGIEIQPEPYAAYINRHENIHGHLLDFMDYRDGEKVDAIIGNPPYVSLKNLNANDRNKTLSMINEYGVDMQTSGSMWMPFTIHATELLAKNGKLGFVLPYEITHVRYAFDLWKYLSTKYGKLTICRVYQDFFPDVDVETIVLLAEKKGYSTNHVEYKVFQTVSDLFANNAYQVSLIYINDIINLQKPFERELMPKSVISFLDTLRQQKRLAPFVDTCKFTIGYVSGNKGYFQITKDDISRWGIRQENARKSLINAKQISANERIGVETKGVKEFSYLFYPENIGDGERNYIEYGEFNGINQGFKCRTRSPWYITPTLKMPDLILTVFGNVPRLLLNNGNFYVTNSLLSGISRISDNRELICRWYNSITLLSIETTIHSLGGGTLVLIPGETDKLELLSEFPKDRIDIVYDKIAEFAKEHKTEDIYQYGDSLVLEEIYGFSNQTIREIREAIMILRNWRDPEKRRS